ncbi:putative tricarboxylic transport membrane protein [Rhizobium sp. RU33A]|uniref:tripartite tricarboxylate transporter permease n=1 Tax=Rhizobium sp. RU33A TaxID=1907413 RepID=UPI0009551B41|nr:tripartite tricarboxylate transporter permease [Rhizobium sp. RU33A]SIR00342.1 putative tricarboxylic transport membrane protein [Rhizobium sp. RU33A]
MFDFLPLLQTAFANLLTPNSLFLAAAASLGGFIIGALPGLTATMGLALLTTMTINMPANDAILVLICTYVLAIYGGSRSAILLNIPGTPSSAATALDGFVLARNGRAGEAMGMATVGSAFGTLVGIALLAIITPPLGELALSFGAYEFFWLALVGVMLSGSLSGNDPVKGWIAGILGLLVAMIGREPAYGVERFTFGFTEMIGGIQLLPAMVGAFGFAEVLYVMRRRMNASISDASDRVMPRLADMIKMRWTIFRSGILGTFIGLLPGVGEDIGAWVSYGMAKRFSKKPEEYGHGSVEGLTAAETGNNASVPGAIIPVLTLGIPGSGVAAVLMAALIIHGAQPGPLMMTTNPQMIYDIIAMLVIATVFILILGLGLTRLMIMVLRVKDTWLMPLVAVMCLIGPYAIQSRFFDIWVVVVFGVIGFGLRLMNYSMAPLVLGIVLGTILDSNMRRSFTLANGDLTQFVSRPISAFLAAIVLMMILAQIGPVRRAVGNGWARLRQGRHADV